MPTSFVERWPATWWLVRHGQSAGNVASEAAEAAGGLSIDLAGRDVDVPLSDLGRRQAQALGRWFREQPAARQPTVLLVSPYARALETAALLTEQAGLSPTQLPAQVDERLRERELGGFNRLTKAGVLAAFPQEAELRARIGKFYHRPPGGESWCDVLLRLRGVLDHVQARYEGQRVLLVAHHVTVLCFRYLIEKLTEAQLLQLDRRAPVPNCSVTCYERHVDAAGAGTLTLTLENFVAPLEQAHEPVTTGPDVPVAPR